MRLVACYECDTKMECTVMDDYGKGGNRNQNLVASPEVIIHQGRGQWNSAHQA